MIRILEQDVKSQSPENGSQHCKPIIEKAMEIIPETTWSQSPENGSQHCKLSRGMGDPVGLGLRVAIP